MKTDFRKRHYHTIFEPVKDIAFILGKAPLMLRNRKNGWVSADFQERLLMAVTAVNGCRYCNYYHTRVALRMGFEPDEVKSLLAGDIDNPDPDEVRALLYAQHWAETNARPDSDLRDQIIDHYGLDRAAVIETIMRMIRFGNLSGNTIDCCFGSRAGAGDNSDFFSLLNPFIKRPNCVYRQDALERSSQ